MSSDNECDAINYGIDDEYAKSFGPDEGFENDHIEEENDGISQLSTDYTVPKFDREVNKSLREQNFDIEQSNEEDGMDDLDEFMNLLAGEDLEREQHSEKAKKPVETQKAKSPVAKPKVDDEEKQSKEPIIKEINTGIRLVKSNFHSDIEIQSRLTSSYGKFHRLSELHRLVSHLKSNCDASWYTIGILGTKSDTKCSAKGNNYMIWQMHDLNNLEHENDVSLFLFGNSYKTHWKTNLYDVFAIIKPDFLDDYKNTNQQKSGFNNKYFADGRTNVKVASNKPGNSVTSSNKTTLSIRNDAQLVHLGSARDIGSCQSFKRQNVGSGESKKTESSQRCKNLVNLTETKHCIYHCKQLSKSYAASNTKTNNNPDKSKYTMGNPNQQASKQYKKQSIKIPFNDSLGGSIKFFDKVHEDSLTNERANGATNSSITIKPIDKVKELKKIKDEAILSLNYKPLDSEPLANVVFKANKASDRELMAKLNDSPLCKDDIIKYRQETYDKGVSYKETNKEMKNLFNTKDFLINNVASITNSISSHKLLELRNSPQLKSSMSAALKADKKLSAMQSHRDIVKEIKKTKDTPDTAKENISADASKPTQATASSNIHAAQFLKQHITDLKILQSGKSQMHATVKQKPQAAANDLELVDDEGKLVAKKLMPSLAASPHLRLSQQQKRKAPEQSSPASTAEPDDKAKRLKLVQDLINIKSTHEKDARDPEKNAHLKAYLERLEEKESVDNRLCSLRKQTVKVITCNICVYTSFRQSDLCRSRRHQIIHREVLQRYFKCKNCNARSFTLDKVCPTSACMQCGSEKFEQCGMKDDSASTKRETMSIDGN